MIESHVILLRIHRLSETSLIVKWLSADEGIIKTVAKGALRPKSPFSGKLDLFFSGEIQAIRQKKGDLHILKEINIHHWRIGLRRQYIATLMAGYFCQLVENCLEANHPESSIYDLLMRALDHLNEKEPTIKALIHFERELASALGIGKQSDAFRAIFEYIGYIVPTRKELIERLTQA